MRRLKAGAAQMQRTRRRSRRRSRSSQERSASAAHGIPPDTVSHPAPYPTRHGTRRLPGPVSHPARYPTRSGGSSSPRRLCCCRWYARWHAAWVCIADAPAVVGLGKAVNVFVALPLGETKGTKSRTEGTNNRTKGTNNQTKVFVASHQSELRVVAHATFLLALQQKRSLGGKKIPRGMASHVAWYPTSHGILRGMVSQRNTVSCDIYPARHGIQCT